MRKLQEALIAEAKLSPQLLADLAGLEIYVAESYDSRVVTELIQNADDANAQAVHITTIAGWVIVANNGKQFDDEDLESLCRSAASKKRRGSSIGYRGIGFESVVGIAEEVFIVSGDTRVCFSRHLTRTTLGGSSSVPLIRIPFQIQHDDLCEVDKHLISLHQSGFLTVIAIRLKAHADISKDFEDIDTSTFLFLKNISAVKVNRGSHTSQFKIERRLINDDVLVTCLKDNVASNWLIATNEKQTSIAVKHEQSRPIACLPNEAVFHAFLPTLDSVGLHIKVNADFSTDPSRTRVARDERTVAAMKDAAELLSVRLFAAAVKGDNAYLSPIVGDLDIRVAMLQRPTIGLQFLALVRDSSERFRSLKLAPNWLKGNTFDMLAQRIGIVHAPDVDRAVLGVHGLLRYLGASEAELEDLQFGLNKPLDRSGATDILAELIKRDSLGSISESLFVGSWPIWFNAARPLSADQLGSVESLSVELVDLLSERGVSRGALKRFLARKNINIGLPEQQASAQIIHDSKNLRTDFTSMPKRSDVQDLLISMPEKPLILKRWRTAEIYVKELFQFRGFTAEDVSKQNLGYDVQVHLPNGSLVGVEVKSLDHKGATFSLTSNEVAAAQEMRANYILALTYQTYTDFEIMFIVDPMNHSGFSFERSCRQWAFECSNYQFLPIEFPFK